MAACVRAPIMMSACFVLFWVILVDISQEDPRICYQQPNFPRMRFSPSLWLTFSVKSSPLHLRDSRKKALWTVMLHRNFSQVHRTLLLRAGDVERNPGPSGDVCMTKKMDKKKILTILMCVLFTMFFLNNADYIVFVVYPIAVVSGVGIGAMYLLPWSMLPDVVDQASLDQGVRREELFYSFYVFFSKFGAGVSLGISTLVLKFGGFDEEQCIQLWSVPLTLKLLLSTASILLVMGSLIFHYLYPINEKVRKEIRARIAEARSFPVRVHYGAHDNITTDNFLDSVEETVNKENILFRKTPVPNSSDVPSGTAGETLDRGNVIFKDKCSQNIDGTSL